VSEIWTPRPHQQLARSFILKHQRCNLWAVPGMGKTSIVYSALDLLKLAGSSFFPALVIAPKKVCELTWPAEQTKWTDFKDMRIVEILGSQDLRDNALMTMGDVYVINYENVPWLISAFSGRNWPFRVVIADESTKLKNFRLNSGGVRSKALSTIAQHTGRWINLTGTPAPNGYKDLWGQQWFVDNGERLGHSHTAYMNRWFVQNQYTRQVELRHPDCKKEIDARLNDCTLALRAEDWMSVHAENRVPREVLLPADARAQYDLLEKNLWVELSNLKEVNAINSAALSQKLLQMASGMVYDDAKIAHWVHDAKVEALRSVIDELQEPLLVSYWYKYEPALLKKAFPDFRLFKNKQDEDDWNAGKIPLMGVHPGSAGHGVNLQFGGRAMAHFTHTWDLELRMQVSERIGPVRQAQANLNRAVIHYDLIAKGTIDEEVLQRIDGKMSVQEALMLAQSRRHV
jgi:SNF2 family DNA or RNA helicase